MSRLLSTAAALTAVAVAVCIIGCIQMSLMIPPPIKPDEAFEFTSVSRPEDLALMGLESALLVFGAGLVLVRVSVIWRWAWPPAAAALARWRRHRFEERALKNYGLKYRVARTPLEMT